jgi:SAM-dependent methyltransferase
MISASPMISACPVCGDGAPPPFLDFGRVPIDCTRRYTDRDAARGAPLGEIQLVACRSCSTVYNRRFDADRVQYDGDYENSQFFSGAFREYAETLAASLLDDNHIDRGLVVEIGSGKGEFLSLLARGGRNRAIGFDPSYRGESDDALVGLQVEIVREFFDERSAPDDMDLVCLRHVLEHIGEPVAFLGRIRSAMATSQRAVLYVEVPNATFTLSASGCWDLIYQHCTYFTRAGLTHALETAGFEIQSMDATFANQFLSAQATIAGRHPNPAAQRAEDAQVGHIGRAQGTAASMIARWHEFLHERESSRIVLWGAGAKGVTFLNVMREHGIVVAVDVNPRKAGTFVPGTGHPVVMPDELTHLGAPVETVVVANRVYEPEVRAQLRELGLEPEVVAL